MAFLFFEIKTVFPEFRIQQYVSQNLGTAGNILVVLCLLPACTYKKMLCCGSRLFVLMRRLQHSRNSCSLSVSSFVFWNNNLFLLKTHDRKRILRNRDYAFIFLMATRFGIALFHFFTKQNGCGHNIMTSTSESVTSGINYFLCKTRLILMLLRFRKHTHDIHKCFFIIFLILSCV